MIAGLNGGNAVTFDEVTDMTSLVAYAKGGAHVGMWRKGGVCLFARPPPPQPAAHPCTACTATHPWRHACLPRQLLHMFRVTLIQAPFSVPCAVCSDAEDSVVPNPHYAGGGRRHQFRVRTVCSVRLKAAAGTLPWVSAQPVLLQLSSSLVRRTSVRAAACWQLELWSGHATGRR